MQILNVPPAKAGLSRVSFSGRGDDRVKSGTKQYGITGIPLEAQYFYRRALEVKNDEQEIKNNGKEEEVLKYLKMAVSIAPLFCNAYNAMGNCLDEMGRYEEAIRIYDKVLELNPQDAAARFKRAMIQKKIRCYEDMSPFTGLSALIYST